MISSALFARYARALADVAMEQRQERQVTEDLAVFREIFRSVPDLLDVFDSPAIPRECKGTGTEGADCSIPRQPDDGELLARSPGTQSDSLLPRDLQLLRQDDKRPEGNRRCPGDRRVAAVRA